MICRKLYNISVGAASTADNWNHGLVLPFLRAGQMTFSASPRSVSGILTDASLAPLSYPSFVHGATSNPPNLDANPTNPSLPTTVSNTARGISSVIRGACSSIVSTC